jgi:thiol-disulfide isomerase/thioredoxin
MGLFGRLLVAAAIGIALGAGVAWFTRESPPPPGTVGAAVGDPQPGFVHTDVNGGQISADDFAGQAMLVNFWATWCAPCRREMPALQTLSERHAGRLMVVGLAIDDAEPVADFVAELGIDYPIAHGQADVMHSNRRWGNAAGALPYTVLVDAEGIIRWQHLGEVSLRQLEQAIAPYL